MRRNALNINYAKMLIGTKEGLLSKLIEWKHYDAGANGRNFLSVNKELIKDDLYKAVGCKKPIGTNDCWLTIPNTLKCKTEKNEYTAVSNLMMYIIAHKLQGLNEIKVFYECAVRMKSPVMRGILLERWILLVLEKNAVQMCHFVMYTNSNMVDGKTSLQVNNEVTYKNPDELIDHLLETDHIIGIPKDPNNPGYDFMYIRFHKNKEEI